MKAEDVLGKMLINDTKEQLINYVQEYAKDQIQKDRERVKLNAKTKLLTEFEFIVDTDFIDDTPIILD